MFAAGRPDRDETLAEAREALRYWRRRQVSLGWHRRAARAEARDHVARWHAHVQRAQLERWGLEPSHPLAPFVGALGLPPREQLHRLTMALKTTRLVRLARRVVAVAAIATLAMFVLAAAVGHLL